jgi:hypothetical protein
VWGDKKCIGLIEFLCRILWKISHLKDEEGDGGIILIYILGLGVLKRRALSRPQF